MSGQTSEKLARRTLLRGAVMAGALVVGFDPIGRRWVRAEEATGCSQFDDLPPLDGTLHLDRGTRLADAGDTGNIIERMPCAVLRPGSVADIVKMIRYCRSYGVQVAARGQGHTTHGQALVSGLLIENRSLRKIHSLGPGGADVDAGVLWQELLLAAHEYGLTPPVLTRYTGLSIAGTLSVGGIGVRNEVGAQVDQVRELEVVTGEGKLRRCSAQHNRDLFEVMLGGLGQCGVITRARVALVPAPPLVRTYVMSYMDNGRFFRDFRTLLDRGELDCVFATWLPNDTRLIYQLNAVKFVDPARPPDDRRLLRGLSQPAAATIITEDRYLTWARQTDMALAHARTVLNWNELVKPYFSVWLGDCAIERYVGEVIETLTRADVGPGGQLLLFALRRCRLTRPFLRVPDGADWVYMFSILATSAQPGPDPAFAEAMLARNRRLYDLAQERGGTQYPVGSVPFERADWIAQYGDLWRQLSHRKRRFDPDTILTPGPGIF